jgi:hypothetical protein
VPKPGPLSPLSAATVCALPDVTRLQAKAFRPTLGTYSDLSSSRHETNIPNTTVENLFNQRLLAGSSQYGQSDQIWVKNEIYNYGV